MTRSAARLGVVLLSWLAAGPAPGGDGPATLPAREPFDLRATQVELAIDRDGRHEPFRATVLAARDDALTVLTAARFLNKEDEGHPVRLFVDGGAIWGVVQSVALNPAYSAPVRSEGARGPKGRLTGTTYYRQIASTGFSVGAGQRDRVLHGRFPLYRSLHYGAVPGADNSIARLRFVAGPEPDKGPAGPAFRAIQPAQRLAAGTYPPPSGGLAIARMVDASGREHAVRAGNFENPRLLEWGHGFDPKAADAGGGVFVIHEGEGGRPEVFLIGVLLGPDDRGGLASMVALEMPWVAEALRERPTEGGAVADDSRLDSAPPGR